ncbi:MAG: hypothetical protein ACRD0U_14800, partial [Acidimicrobiales bacterium]
ELDRGLIDVAEPLLDEAGRIFAELEDPAGDVTVALPRAHAARLRGQLDRARAILRDGLAATRELGYVGDEARLLAESGSVELDAGDPAAAERAARASLALVRSGVGERDSEHRALLVLAAAAIATGDRDGGRLSLEEAVALGGTPPTSMWRQANAALAMCLAADDTRHGAEGRMGGQPGSAARAFDHAALASDGAEDSAGTWVAARRATAAALVAEGRLDEAATELRVALARFDGALAFLAPVRKDLGHVTELGACS